jgi:hypothetical protein
VTSQDLLTPNFVTGRSNFFERNVVGTRGVFYCQTGTPEQFKAALGKYGLDLLLRQMKVGETLTWK